MIWTLLTFFFLSAGTASAQPQVDSLCHPQERILFSCILQDQSIVSICTQPKTVPVHSVEFRYGNRDTIKTSYLSSTQNDRRFSANVLPANPKASVREVWFDLNGSRYIVTQCVGGRCPHSGGMIIYRGDRVESSKACTISERNQPWFEKESIDFSSGISNAMSHTDLIRFDDDWSEVEALYPYQMTD